MNETLKTIHNLRTIHGDFSDKEITPGDLQTILDAAVQTATASAMQLYSIVVIEDKEVMKQLGYQGSKTLLFCVDINRHIDLANHMDYQFPEANPEWFVTGSSDTMLAAQTAVIAAKSLGIDSLLTNCVHRGDMERVYRLVELPRENCFPLIALVLGYPRKEPENHIKGRLKGPGVIHYGKYTGLSEEEIKRVIDEYDDSEKIFLELIKHWKRAGSAHYLDYFYSKWLECPRKSEAKVPESSAPKEEPQIVEILKKTNFLH
ncbi:MAG: nitroreductase [bacterium]|nr:nitroreductase [bacterium]